jgi:pimeloyl-ACP methyl ester carboxylesterase
MLKFICAAVIAAAPLTMAAQPAAAEADAAAFQPTRFSVLVEGEGSDVILIPGLSSPRDVWDGARAALRGRHRLHLVQIAGFGGTEPGPNSGDGILEGTVAELRRYIAANGLQRPAVIGHSMGGLIGLMLAQEAPDMVGRLMVVDALPFIGILFDPAATAGSIAPRAAAMRDMMAAATPDQRRAAAAAVAASLVRSEAARALVARWMLESNAGVSSRAMYEDMVTDVRPGLAAIRIPVTVLYAWAEGSLPEARAAALFGEAYRALPGVRMAGIGESAHFLMLDQPERFGAALAEFLADR